MLHQAAMFLLCVSSQGVAVVDPTDCTVLQCDRMVDIAIVGAGPAGTYSSYKLRKAGLAVELFEYSNRIGGRLYTSFLPNVPDAPNLELGGMRFIDGLHLRVQRLVQELNLTVVEFVEGFGRAERAKYFLRGKRLTTKEVKSGNVPYDLSEEEKVNQANIVRYYLEKLTGFNGSVTDDHALTLRTKTGRELYKLTIHQALELVATPDGISYVKDLIGYGRVFIQHASAGEIFLGFDHLLHQNTTFLTLKEGMSTLVKSMATAFLQSSHSHKITLNRKLETIGSKKNGFYQLELLETVTEDGVTRVTGTVELVCARQVFLAIPQFALTRLKWEPLCIPEVMEALHAVIPVPVNKIYMTFSKAWWLKDTGIPIYVMKSDLPFSQMYDWKSSNVSGSYTMLASYSDAESTAHMEKMNSAGSPIPGSAVGSNKVTSSLKEELINHIGQALGINREIIPEPISAISQFWTKYPFGGGLTVWKAGYNYSDVRQVIRRPSLKDDVFIIGSDHAFLGTTSWVDGALLTVDEVFETYFSHIYT